MGSAFVITIILRSSIKLSSTYHRILMPMSVLDIIGSTAVALTSLPVPMDDKWVNLYNYDGRRVGNYASCDAQGFFQFFGFLGEFLYYMMLCVYYACTLAFSMKEETITKFVEPWMHIIPLTTSLWISLEILLTHGYNPAPKSCAWCTMNPLPYSCLEPPPSPSCERGNKESHLRFELIFAIISTVKIVVIIICLSMVCGKVTKLYLEWKKSKNDDGTGGMTEEGRVDLDNRFRIVRATFIQAIAYILVLFITVLPPLVLLITPATFYATMTDVFNLAFPLQGFFNFLIFVGAKVYHYRRVESEVSISKALGLILFTSFHDAETLVFTGISVLYRDGDFDLSSSEPPSDYDEEAEDVFNESLSPRFNESIDRTESVVGSEQSRLDDLSWPSNINSVGNSCFQLSEDLSLSTT